MYLPGEKWVQVKFGSRKLENDPGALCGMQRMGDHGWQMGNYDADDLAPYRPPISENPRVGTMILPFLTADLYRLTTPRYRRCLAMLAIFSFPHCHIRQRMLELTAGLPDHKWNLSRFSSQCKLR